MDVTPRLKTSTIVTIVAMLPLVLTVVLSLKTYEVWPQIIYMWDMQADPIVELGRVHPHALRYMLLYPILVLSDYLGIHHDRLFSATLVIFCFFTIKNIHTSADIIVRHPRHSGLVHLACASILTILFFLMNGRIGFAFLGYSMLLLVILRNHYESHFSFASLTGVLVGLALCSVSSGTLVSAVLCLVVAVYFEVCRCIRRSALTKTAIIVFLCCLLLGVALFRFLLVGISRNITFYGGGSDGVLRMLEHGFGRPFYPALNAIGLPSVVAMIAIMTILFGVLLFRMKRSLMLHIVLAAIACGAFGYSTLSISAIPLLIMAAALLTDRGVAWPPRQGPTTALA